MKARHVLRATLAAAVMVAVAGGTLLSASASATARIASSPAAASVVVASGLHGARLTVNEKGVRFSFKVPPRAPGEHSWWERFSSISTDKFRGGPISLNKSFVGPQGAEAIIYWTSFPDGDYADPCAGELAPSIGRSAADLAAAVSTAPGTTLVKGPLDITLGGRPAKHVVLRVRKNIGCDPGFFYSWREVFGGAFWLSTDVGDTIRVWIVPVGGTRLFIAAAIRNGWPKKEVTQIVESIRFT